MCVSSPKISANLRVFFVLVEHLNVFACLYEDFSVFVAAKILQHVRDGVHSWSLVIIVCQIVMFVILLQVQHHKQIT